MFHEEQGINKLSPWISRSTSNLIITTNTTSITSRKTYNLQKRHVDKLRAIVTEAAEIDRLRHQQNLMEQRHNSDF